MSRCYACGNEFPEDLQVYRTTECVKCKRDVKVCKNCFFYSPNSNNECREPIAEPVLDKEKSNFCDYFKLGDQSGGKMEDKAKKARTALDNLFGDV